MSTAKRPKGGPEIDDKTLDEVLVSLVERFPDGLPLAQVRTLLPPAYRVTKTRLDDRLRALAAEVRIHRWGPRAVAPRPFAARAEEAIVSALGDGPRTPAELKRLLPAPIRGDAKGLQRALDGLTRAGRIYEHPKPPGAKKGALQLALVPAEAALYVAPVEKALGALLKKLAKTGIDRARVLAALGASPDGGPAQSKAATAPARTEAPGDRARAFVEGVLAVRPDARLHLLVSVRDVRRHLGWPKAELDGVVLALAREGRITLHQHDHPAGLSLEERAELVADERGNHFIGLVLEDDA